MNKDSLAQALVVILPVWCKAECTQPSQGCNTWTSMAAVQLLQKVQLLHVHRQHVMMKVVRQASACRSGIPGAHQRR